MSIERNLRQTHWGVMKTNVSTYFNRLAVDNVIDLLLDGYYYGVVGNNGVNVTNVAPFHLFGMVQRDGVTASTSGKSVFGIYQEDRNSDQLIFKSIFILEEALQVGKGKFNEPPTGSLKNNEDCFSVHRTATGFELSYLSTQGNAYFRARYVVAWNTGVATVGGVPSSVPAVQMRKNDDPAYRTWPQIMNNQLGLTGTASISNVYVAKPHKTRNNNGWDYLGNAGTSVGATSSVVTSPANGRVFLLNLDPDLDFDSNPDVARIVSYVWQNNTSSAVIGNLETWWNSKLPLDTYNNTVSVLAFLNHPVNGLYAIFEKVRNTDLTTRRYFADLGIGNELVDISTDQSDCNFVLNRMVASLNNVTCYTSYDNDRYDQTDGKLLYTLSKKVNEKASSFALRLLNYDLNGKGVAAFNSDNHTYFTSFTNDETSKIVFGYDLVYVNDPSNNTFHLEREDMGNVFSDGIGVETYYLTGIRPAAGLGKPMFVGYSAYPANVGSFTINILGGQVSGAAGSQPPVAISFN
jgi:hypothetical protein